MGISGRIAAYFQHSAMTPLLAIILLLLGVFATLVTPREEEPQIDVTLPGAGTADGGVAGYRADGWNAVPHWLFTTVRLSLEVR